MTYAPLTPKRALGRGRIVMTKRGLAAILATQDTRLVLCPIYEAPALTHRADIPLSWRDELNLGLKYPAVIRAVPFIKQCQYVTPHSGQLSALTLAQLVIRTQRELQTSAQKSAHLPLFSGRRTNIPTSFHTFHA